MRAATTNANLTNVDLIYTDLTNANLTNANLSGTDFTEASFFVCHFENAELNNHTKLDVNFSFYEWNERYLDIYLNSENNGSSIITAINSISDNYQEQKIKLFHKLIDSLNKSPTRLSLASVAFSILDDFTKWQYCNQDKKISDWLSAIIVPLYLEKINDTAIGHKEDKFNYPILRAYESNTAYMLRYNSAFIQLISQLASSDSGLKEQGQTLYNSYLQHTRIKPYTGSDFGNYDGHPDWLDKNAYNLILISKQENSDYTMIISQNQLEKMLNIKSRDEHFNWNSFYLYQDSENIGAGRYNLGSLFDDHFSLFAANFRFEQKHAQFKKLLEILSLGEFTLIFKQATTKRTSEMKLIDAGRQAKMAEIFNKTFKQYKENTGIHYRLTPEYQQQLFSAYQLKDSDEKKQAQVLLSLAAVFSKYSSSAIFGTETESPNVLRYFSSALANKAYELSPIIFENEKQYKDWTNRLLGYNNAFSCTAVLSGIMVEHIKKRFPNTLADIMPPAWN